MEKEREYLTKEQAIELVGGKREEIHCFLNPGGMLVGADWSWKEFVDLLDKSEVIEKAGEQAQAMNHPLAVYSGKWYFFEKTEETK